MSLLCRNTDGEVVQVVKLRYVHLKLAVVCGSFAPELGVGLRSSSRRAEHSPLTARSHPTGLAASQQLVVSEGKVISSWSCCDNVFRRWDSCGWKEGGLGLACYLVFHSLSSLPCVFDDRDCYKQARWAVTANMSATVPGVGSHLSFPNID